LEDRQLARLVNEEMMACAILNWLSDEGLILDYALDVERSGEAWLTCQLRYSTLELHSFLGSVEVATDLAHRLLGDRYVAA
jgi:hypothetical protein